MYIFTSELPLPSALETLLSQLPFIYIDFVFAMDKITWKTSVLTASLVLSEELNSSITAELHVCSTALQNSAEAASSILLGAETPDPGPLWYKY